MAASEEAQTRDRGALSPLPLGRKSNGVAAKPSASSIGAGHRLEITDWLQKIYRIISE